MSSAIVRPGLKPLETRTTVVGFLLVGIVIAVTAVCYVANMTFDFQWLVGTVADVSPDIHTAGLCSG